MARKRANSVAKPSSYDRQLPPRELIVLTTPQTGLRASAAGLTSVAGADVSDLESVLENAGARLLPLFGESEERIEARTASMATSDMDAVPQLAAYYRVDAPDEKLDALAKKLNDLDTVEAAYVKPAAEPPVLNEMPPSPEEAPPATPDFTSRQGYLNAAPGGVDARYAWTKTGGGGANVRIIDIEGAWRFGHEDLVQNQGGVVGGTPSTDIGWRNHGTAVIGEFGGDRNNIGVTGICPDANVRAISIFGAAMGSSAAIRRAADLLSPGDIILIELHRPGPRFNFQNRPDQRGYIAVEWWPDDYDAIRYAFGRGVIVVEAAGNGAENLDDNLYNTPGLGFPSSWANPFRRGARDSGAVLVGAGAPPSGNFGNDRSRLDFSNYGAAVDTQGWGREVTTTGYGDLQGGSNEDLWYTSQFSGTSSASPIVVGSVGCVQGFLRGSGRTPQTPTAMRNLLRSTGSPQQAGPSGPASQRIGNRPNIRQMIDSFGTVTPRIPLYRYWNPNNTDHFYTTNWAELGAGRFGWGYEGIQGYVFSSAVAGTVPLYRYWNPSIGDHFYTTNWAELGSGRHGWNYEGIQCYVRSAATAGAAPLYRYWNSSAGDHFYTTNWAELGNGAHGWVFEGIQCWVYPSATGAPLAPETPAPMEESTAAELSLVPASDTVPASFQTDNGLGAVPATFTAMTAGLNGDHNGSSFATKGATNGQKRGLQVTFSVD